MKIAIIGSGAIGCLYGAYLSRNNDIYMLCRREKVRDSINKNGITVFKKDGGKEVFKDNIKAYVSGECDEIMNLVIVIVKTYDTDTSLETNLKLIGDKTMVMTMQNGGGNDLVLNKYVPMERIIISTTRHNAINLDNGNIYHSGGGETYIGSNIKGINLEHIAKEFIDAGFETIVSDDIQRIIWSKLFVNLSANSFTAITKAKIGHMIDNDNSWFFAQKIICEAIDVARALGLDFSYDEVLKSVHELCEKVSTGLTSMSQDVMNCRKTEIDSINGFVVSTAKLHNLSAPYNEFVCNLVHAIEHTYKIQEMEMEKYHRDDIIIRQGDKSDYVYKVMHGSVSLYSDYASCKEYLFGVYAKDRFFGEYSCFTNQSNLFTVVANEDTIVMKIAKQDIHQYISINPQNAESMIRDLSRQTAMLLKNVEMIIEE